MNPCHKEASIHKSTRTEPAQRSFPVVVAKVLERTVYVRNTHLSIFHIPIFLGGGIGTETNRVCCMSTGRKNGFMWRTHTYEIIRVPGVHLTSCTHTCTLSLSCIILFFPVQFDWLVYRWYAVCRAFVPTTYFFLIFLYYVLCPSWLSLSRYPRCRRACVCVCRIQCLCCSHQTVLSTRRHPAHPVSVPIRPPINRDTSSYGHKTTTQEILSIVMR